jgi:tripartite-type tricarboxylate transporter receptor subunit TctC
LKKKSLLASVIFIVSLIGCHSNALAQSWPTREPIRIVAPFAAGSAIDLMARVVYQQVSTQIGQAVVIENRTGAGGTIGMAYVAHAKPDGYTLLASSSAHTTTPAVYKSLPYNASTDLIGIIPFGQLPNVMVVAPGKYKELKDLVAYGKANPKTLTYGSAGIGAVAHLNAERFRLAAGFDALHVPFRGAPAALAEVIAGRVDFYFSPLAAALPLIQSGQVQALAVSTTKRSPSLPNIPTTIELGYADSEFTFWGGLCGPSGLPKDIVATLYQQTRKALDVPAVKNGLEKLGVEPMPLTPDEFDAYLKAEINTIAKLVRIIGIEPN